LSKFLEPLRVELIDDGDTWQVLEPFDYDIGEVGGEKIEVPEGTITDFGSVPKPLWGLISPIGKATRGFVLHDYCYQVQIYTRSKCDKILLEALGVLGVSWLKRRAIYVGVRLGGWIPWNKHSRELKKEQNNAKQSN
jgi:hypothetical protein